MMLSIASFIAGWMLTLWIIFLLDGTSEHDIIYFLPIVPVAGTIIFYIIRRRYRFSTTVKQALVSILAMLVLAYPMRILIDLVPVGIPLLLMFVVFVLTKHISDKMIAAKLQRETKGNTP